MGSAIFSLLSSLGSKREKYQDRYYFPGNREAVVRYIRTNVDGSVKSPTSALRCILRHCSVL
ncbi:MAG: hypothetical protein ACE5NJ_02690, partial [Thermodesulfobacteriota bacterium]